MDRGSEMPSLLRDLVLHCDRSVPGAFPGLLLQV